MPTTESPDEAFPTAPESSVASKSKGALMIAIGAFLLLVLLIVTNMK